MSELGERGRVLGLDLGERRIGVAVSDAGRKVATGVEVIQRSSDRRSDHARISRLVEEYGAVGVVVGLPLSLTGAEGAAARSAREEIAQLRDELQVEVTSSDERFTTVVAAGALRASGRRGRRQKTVIDQTAAAVLLQSWMDRSAGAQGASR